MKYVQFATKRDASWHARSPRARRRRTCGRHAGEANFESLDSRTLFSAPAAPSDLHALTVSTSQINITWKDNSTEEDGFEIDYSTSETFSSNVSTLIAPQETNSKWITGLAPSTPYFIRVRAVKANGEESANTSKVDATTPGTGTVRTVSGFTKAAIISAINSSNDGDTIRFSSGTYNVTSRIRQSDLNPGKYPGRGRVYEGTTVLTTNEDGTTDVEPGSILVSSSTEPVFLFEDDTPIDDAKYNIRFTGLTFEGWGLDLQKFISDEEQYPVHGIVVDNCHFVAEGGGNRRSITFTTGLHDTSIINNVFDVIDGEMGLYGHVWNHLTIANNEFRGETQTDPEAHRTGMQLLGHPGDADLLVEQNYFTDLHRMGIEFLAGDTTGGAGGDDAVFQENYYENPRLGPTTDDNLSLFAFSPVNDRATGTISRRNFAKAPTAPANGNGVRIMFELGGYSLDSYDNNSDGGWRSMAVTGQAASGTVRNNRVLNSYATPEIDPGKNITATLSNNGPSVVPTWDLNRPRPGPHRRVNGLALASGVLTVSGTKLVDSVAITDDGTSLTFTLNGEPFTYPVAEIDEIEFAAQATPNSSSGTIITKSLSIPTGLVLDLTNNSMIIDYTGSVGTLVSDVRQHLQNGGLITSSGVSQYTGIGYADNAIAGFGRTTFAGQPIDTDSVLLKFTYFGDAELDGDVDIGDLGRVSLYAQGPWTTGDFDYDGTVLIGDLGLLSGNYGAGYPNPLRPSGEGGQEPDPEFVSLVKEMGLSEEEISELLSVLGANGGGPVL